MAIKPFSISTLPILLGGSLLSKVGDGVHELVFVVTVLNVTGNTVGEAGVVYFLRFIPYFLLGPVGGSLSDSLSRKWLMICSDIGRLFVVGIFSWLLINRQVTTVSIAVLGMLMTAFRTIFQPAFQSVIPSIVSKDALPKVNATIQIVGEVGGLVGPALGGLALGIFKNAGHVLIFDALTFALSALSITLARLPERPSQFRKGSGRTSVLGLYGDFGRNLIGVYRQRQLFVSIAYSAVCILFVGASLRILIPSMLKNAGYDDSFIGYSMSIAAGGTIIGAVICGKIVTNFTTARLMLYWCSYGIVLSILPVFVGNSVTIISSLFVFGIVGAFVDVVLSTNIQKLSAENNIGRNFSIFSTLANTGEALSGGLAGLIVLFSSVGIGVCIMGVATACVSYIGKLNAVTTK